MCLLFLNNQLHHRGAHIKLFVVFVSSLSGVVKQQHGTEQPIWTNEKDIN